MPWPKLGRKKWQVLGAVALTSLSFLLFVEAGNNRVAVYFNQGIWLPPSAREIVVLREPPFIVVTDDVASSKCVMSLNDFRAFLAAQRYKYELGRRMLGVGRYAIDESDWLPVPPALAERLPVALKLQSPRGDFMVLQAERAGHDTVRVELSTDWN